MADATTPAPAPTGTTPAPSSTALGAAPAPTTTPAGASGSPPPPASASSGAPGAEGQTGAPPAGDKAAPTAAPAPLELKLPDGIDAKSFEPFKALAGKLGLDSPKAQQLVDMFLADRAQVAKAHSEQFTQTLASARSKWQAETRADPDIGAGNPETLAANVALAKRGLENLAGPRAEKVRAILNATGLGDNPDIIYLFSRAGKAVSEDSIAGASGAGGAQGEEAYLRTLYPTMHKKE